MIARLLSRRRRGVIAVLALVGLVPVTAMMTSNLNTSQIVDDRRQAQDAADALARAHGIWSARAMNVIAMNNVTTTQLLTISVGSEALYMTTSELHARAAAVELFIGAHAAQHCRPVANAFFEAPWIFVCGVWHTALAVPAILAHTRAANINQDFDPKHGIRTARKALKAIDGMNKALAARHPRAMGELAEGYYGILEIDAHHYADPCIDGGAKTCKRTNSTDGMSLPLEPAGAQAYLRLAGLLELGAIGHAQTLAARGFDQTGGPVRKGGSRRNPHVRDHINSATEIGVALYDFWEFYDDRVSDLPRHPLLGPGNATFRPPSVEISDSEEPGDNPFDDETTDLLDGLEKGLEATEDVTRAVLEGLRNAPLFYDRIPRIMNYPTRQSIRGNNAFKSWFSMYLATVATPALRNGVLFAGIPPFAEEASPVPEIWQLKDIGPLDITRPVEPRQMTDPYHILGLSLKERSQRLGQTVLGTPDVTHTAYGQVGLYNPDGASMFNQTWRARIMPATRVDNPSEFARDLNRQATSDFDTLANDIGQVSSQAWERVNAH